MTLVCKVLGDAMIKNFQDNSQNNIFSSFFLGIITKFLFCKLSHFPNKFQFSSEVSRNFITNVKHNKSNVFFYGQH